MLHLQDWDVSAEQSLFDSYGSDYIHKLAIHLGFCGLSADLIRLWVQTYQILFGIHTNMIIVIF